jgi:anaerobic magnesium-protoporphyrin IX monomethyl ester cyclase
MGLPHMDILFINPPWVRRKGNLWRGVASVMPPLGLAWMAAVLERDGHRVRILDAHAEGVGLDRIAARLVDFGRPELIGITATTCLIGNARQIAQAARATFPDARIVMGGVHPTVLPEEVLQEPAVDAVVRGEGEETIRELAAGRPLEAIDGVSFRDGERSVHNPDRALIRDLDSLPMPAYHLLPMHLYHPAVGAYRRLPAVSMLATRGCPGRCTFCYRIFGPRLRVRSGERLADEAAHLQERYGIREISFYDDTFTSVKPEVHAFCRAIRERRMDLTWCCFSRVDTVDEELLRAMKDAGCHQVMYGIESASNQILENINKRTDLARAIEAVRITQRVGIDVRAAFMLGNPGETVSTMEETLSFAIRLNPELAIFNVTTPFPGTEIFEWAERNGLLRTKDWEEYDLAGPVMDLPTVSADEIRAFYRRAHRRFYMRPSYMLRRLCRLRRPSELAQAFRALKILLRLGS